LEKVIRRKVSLLFIIMSMILLWITDSDAMAASKLVENRVSGNDLYSIAYNGELYVAGASYGQVLVSKDLTSWRTIKIPQIESYYRIDHVIWDGKQFIGSGRDSIIYSTDGFTWKVKKLVNIIPYDSDIKGSAYVKDLYYDGQVVIGVIAADEFYANVKFISSTNGENWTVSQKYAGWLHAVASNGSRFVSLGGYSNEVNEKGIVGAYSMNKSQWQYTVDIEQERFAYRNNDSWDILWDQRRFVAVGRGNLVYASSDGSTWELLGEIPVQSASKNKEDVWFSSIVWNGQQYTAVGGVNKGAYSFHAIAATSQDGVSWQVQELPYIKTSLHDVIWANNQFVSIGNTGNVLISEDGLSWRNTYEELIVSSEMNNNYSSFYRDGEYWLSTDASYEDLHGGIYRSKDGATWELAYSRYDAKGKRIGILSMISTSKGIYAVTSDGYFVKSTDGVGWTEQRITSNTNIDPRMVAWSGSKFIVLAVDTTDGTRTKWVQFSSSTGSQWAYHPVASKIPSFYQVKHNGDLFYSFNAEKNIFSTSIDGVTWTQRLKVSKDIYDMLVVNKRFYLWGDNIIYTSQDGVKWDKHVMPKDTADIVNTIWDGTKFIGVQTYDLYSAKQYLAESKDGVHWTRLGEFAYSGAEFEMYMLFHKNDHYIYMDRFGGLYRSTVEQTS